MLEQVDESRVLIDALLDSEDCAKLLEDAKLDADAAPPRDEASLPSNMNVAPTKMTFEGRGSVAFGEDEET